MKKSELNSTAKAEIKKIQKEIAAILIAKLKTVTGKLGEATDQLEKEILKGSKKLAKKVVKELKISGHPVVAEPKDQKAKPAAKAGKKAEPKSVVKEQAKPAPEKQTKTTKTPKAKTPQTEKKKDSSPA